VDVVVLCSDAAVEFVDEDGTLVSEGSIFEYDNLPVCVVITPSRVGAHEYSVIASNAVDPTNSFVISIHVFATVRLSTSYSP
jgi:hypothetical protein